MSSEIYCLESCLDVWSYGPARRSAENFECDYKFKEGGIVYEEYCPNSFFPVLVVINKCSRFPIAFRARDS